METPIRTLSATSAVSRSITAEAASTRTRRASKALSSSPKRSRFSAAVRSVSERACLPRGWSCEPEARAVACSCGSPMAAARARHVRWAQEGRPGGGSTLMTGTSVFLAWRSEGRMHGAQGAHRSSHAASSLISVEKRWRDPSAPSGSSQRDPQLALETIATGTKQACAHSLGYENALEPCQTFVGKGLEDLHQLAVAAVQDQFPDCRCDFFRGQHLGLVDVHATHDGPCA